MSGIRHSGARASDGQSIVDVDVGAGHTKANYTYRLRATSWPGQEQEQDARVRAQIFDDARGARRARPAFSRSDLVPARMFLLHICFAIG